MQWFDHVTCIFSFHHICFFVYLSTSTLYQWLSVCPSGKFSGSEGSPNCLECSQGKYSSTSGSTVGLPQCRACDTIFFTYCLLSSCRLAVHVREGGIKIRPISLPAILAVLASTAYFKEPPHVNGAPRAGARHLNRDCWQCSWLLRFETAYFQVYQQKRN